MGKVVKPQKVKLFIGIIFQDTNLLNNIKKKLSSKFGAIDLESQTLTFNYTGHYEKEFGKDLKRKFFSFARLIPPSKISEIKTITNKLEKRFLSAAGMRRINIDPGYLTQAKVILATAKDYAHRIYLRKGIYAETTLTFTKDSFRPYNWTYPDYQTKEYIDIFNYIRQIFREQKKT